MRKRKRRTFTPEFKREAVQLCEVGERSIAQVAKDLDLTETALREWVKRAEIDAGKGLTDFTQRFPTLPSFPHRGLVADAHPRSSHALHEPSDH